MKKRMFVATGVFALLLLLFQPAMASLYGTLGSDEDENKVIATVKADEIADANEIADDQEEADLEDENDNQIPDVVEDLDEATVAYLRDMKLGYGQIAQIFDLAEKCGVTYSTVDLDTDDDEDYDDFEDIVELFTKHDDINGGYGQAKKALEDKIASVSGNGTLVDEQGTDDETSDTAAAEKVNKGQTVKAAKAQINAARTKK